MNESLTCDGHSVSFSLSDNRNGFGARQMHYVARHSILVLCTWTWLNLTSKKNFFALPVASTEVDDQTYGFHFHNPGSRLQETFIDTGQYFHFLTYSRATLNLCMKLRAKQFVKSTKLKHAKQYEYQYCGRRVLKTLKSNFKILFFYLGKFIHSTWAHETFESAHPFFQKWNQFVLNKIFKWICYFILYNTKGKCYTWFPGMMPPQNATSTNTLSEAAFNFSAKFSLVVVGGIEFLNTK